MSSVSEKEQELLEQLEQAAPEDERREARVEDYLWDKSQEMYWDVNSQTLHNAAGVDGSIPQARWRVDVQDTGRGVRERLIPPSKDILRIETNQTVESNIWWPGKPKIIKDMVVNQQGVVDAKGFRCLNLYVAPKVVKTKKSAKLWVDHIKALWPDPVEHGFFFDYCAHMLQHPDVKCNAAIVLSGAQGVGKDAAMLPIKAAVGSWNTNDIDPDDLFSAYEPWKQSLMLIINEVRPTKDDHHASHFYNVLKPLTAAPPMTLAVNDKYAKIRQVVNVMRVFMTTNDWMSMHIPEEDRRLFIMHSPKKNRWAAEDYFRKLFGWFENGGCDAVATWLRDRDISKFDPKGLVPKTIGWKAVVATWGEGDDAVGLALENLGNPDVVLTTEMIQISFDGGEEIKKLALSARRIGHRMGLAGYVPVPRPEGGPWRFGNAHSGGQMRSKLAFVKKDLILNGASPVEAILEHGKTIAAKQEVKKTG